MLLPLGKFSGNFQGKNFNHFFFDGKFVGADFFLLHDGKFCKEKLEAGPGFQFSTFADRVREISWGRDFKRLNFFSLGKVGAGASKNCWARGGPFKR